VNLFENYFASLQRVLLISECLNCVSLFFLVLQTVVSSLVELTILEISGLEEDIGGFIMETITLSNQGATVSDLGMPISFWMSVCVLKTIYSLWLDLDVMSLWLKTMYVAVVLYGYLSRWCSEKYICCWRCVSHEISVLFLVL
jgi:hypothetical protein